MVVRTRSTTSGSLRDARNVAAVVSFPFPFELLEELAFELAWEFLLALALPGLAALEEEDVGANPFNGCFLFFLNMLIEEFCAVFWEGLQCLAAESGWKRGAIVL